MSGLIQGYVWLARLPDALNNPQAKAILARIADGVNDAGDGVRSLARSWIAEDVALSDSSVKRWIARLREAGLLSSEGGGAGRGDAPVYRIDVDLLASMIPEARRPAPFRRAAADENKGVTGDPLSEKGGQSCAKRGSLEGEKGVTGAPPLQEDSTERTTLVVERAREDSIIEAWRRSVGEVTLTAGDQKRLRESIDRNGEETLLAAIEHRSRTPFLRGEVSGFEEMPISWLWRDEKLGRVARGKYAERPARRTHNGRKSVMDDLREAIREAEERDRARRDGGDYLSPFAGASRGGEPIDAQFSVVSDA